MMISHNVRVYLQRNQGRQTDLRTQMLSPGLVCSYARSAQTSLGPLSEVQHLLSTISESICLHADTLTNFILSLASPLSTPSLKH